MTIKKTYDFRDKPSTDEQILDNLVKSLEDSTKNKVVHIEPIGEIKGFLMLNVVFKDKKVMLVKLGINVKGSTCGMSIQGNFLN